ncbi:DUF2207 domain-containing protein [Salinicoccus halodurans]|uniref:Predicted membrane protein n=1 Tax=Salinicoccus halodurans TaxID=407035 RepID=A0A0F7HLA1_9STAP|nr:DUF2207 domain-containing protein [Salinicoccus halodurans]AKG73867.1 hypothetical protein AAT16_06270 [Salinicoccus halodurans]SFK57026.1 Predicted membrane protein [Salinicoccus halodurans]
MKHLFTILMALTAVLAFGQSAEANEINNLELDIHINEDGSVSVTETRKAEMTEGTENYMTFNEEDMGEVEVTDFSVEGYTEETDWDQDAELEEKAGKYGVIETDDGIELVWGIGEYGEQTYVVNYTLENVVRNLEDGQSLYWNFDTFSDLPTEDFTMNVTSEVPLGEDMRFWGFGFEGDINRSGDGITWNAEETLTDANDAVLLMHFAEGTYNTSVTDDGTLASEAEAAKDGSIYDDGSLSGWAIGSIVGGIFAVGLALILIVKRFTSRMSKAGHIDSAAAINRRNKDHEAAMPPEIDDYAAIAMILKHLHMGGFEEIFQAYLMKWTNEGNITIEIDSDPDKKLDKGTTEIFIRDYHTMDEPDSYTFKEFSDQLKDMELGEDGYEPLLWRMLIEAADDGGRINEERLTKWSKKNAKAVSKVADKIEKYSAYRLQENGCLKYDTEKIFGITVPLMIPTEKLLDHLTQYKNYLKEDYGRIHKNADYRQHMIWSVLVGEDHAVKKYLSKLTPEDRSDAYPAYMHYYYGPHMVSQSWSKGLGQGGFSSSAASGSGGATGAGGGAGAGGGGGGGAR